jgi:hypothetical protein
VGYALSIGVVLPKSLPFMACASQIPAAAAPDHMFAQFTDEWVQDKLLFQFMTEGDCSCCGLSLSMSSTSVQTRRGAQSFIFVLCSQARRNHGAGV